MQIAACVNNNLIVKGSWNALHYLQHSLLTSLNVGNLVFLRF